MTLKKVQAARSSRPSQYNDLSPGYSEKPDNHNEGVFNYFLQGVTSKFFQFSGRASRKEYWSFMLGVFLTVLVSLLILKRFDISAETIAGAFGLLFFIPGTAVCVRRLHDIGLSGWWYLSCLIPAVNSVLTVVLGVIPSQSGANRYDL